MGSEIRCAAIERAGTRWPIPPSWVLVGEDTFRGADGLVSVRVSSGALIDPHRCKSADEIRDANWQLVRTINGTALCGRYSEQGAHVLVYSVRVDQADTSMPDEDLPEAQISYVFTNHDDEFLVQIPSFLKATPIDPQIFGMLDEYGHAALGPVPIPNSWFPVGEYVDNTASLGDRVIGEVSTILVGGGWVTWADRERCCGMQLQPRSWRRLTEQRVRETAAADAASKALQSDIVSTTEAHVWGSPLGPGFSYELRGELRELRGLGAYWRDPFDQVWSLVYWVNPKRHSAVVDSLRRNWARPDRG